MRSSVAMDLRQLQAFLAVVDHGGFTAAAKATHTVQSNISTHVARLERELDATLIDRSSGRFFSSEKPEQSRPGSSSPAA